MSDTGTLPPRTHNMPPIVIPTNEALLADLQTRYPDLNDKLDEFEKALATFPAALTLADEDIAGTLADLLGKMRDQKAAWAGVKKNQKKPWDGLVKVVQNFFGKGEEKIDGWIEVWKPRLQVFTDLKEADNKRKVEEAAEAHRREAKRLADEAEAAAERRRAAEQAEAEARRREEEALQAAERAETEKREALARAAAAKAEEDRIAREKRERDRAEKDQNVESLRAIKRHMKDAEKLHALGEADEASEAETRELDEIIRPGGTVSTLAAPVASSALLDDDQKTDIEAVRARLTELRAAVNARYSAKERKRREKERLEAEAAEATAAAERKRKREEEEAVAAEAKAKREKADAEALAAREAEKAAKGDAKGARSEIQDALGDRKDAERAGKAFSKDADRAANRADRADRKIENSTDADFSRTRGDLGSVTSTTGRWVYDVVDEAAVRRVCGPLGEHFTTDALTGAVYRWMGAHREGFVGERATDANLPGVVFRWERDIAIKT